MRPLTDQSRHKSRILGAVGGVPALVVLDEIVIAVAIVFPETCVGHGGGSA
jgi:hypothetical protein